MKIGDKVEVERLKSGQYAIRREGQPTLVGAAASTAMTLNTIVFMDEARSGMEFVSDAA